MIVEQYLFSLYDELGFSAYFKIKDEYSSHSSGMSTSIVESSIDCGLTILPIEFPSCVIS